MIPTGFRFCPTDEEVIDILTQKVSGNATEHLNFIVESNVYELEPQDLEWVQSAVFNGKERYYYCKRENDSREVSGRGWWKATSHVKTISANGRVVGYKRPLTFHRFRDGQRKRKDPIKTDWIMHEYSLHSIPTEWRLCKIKYKGKERLEEDSDSIRNTSSPVSLEAAGGSSSPIDPMQLDQLAIEEQQFQLPLPLINNDYENYTGSNYTRFETYTDEQQPISSFDPSWMPLSHYFASLQHNQSADQPTQAQFPFPDLWSSWENWH